MDYLNREQAPLPADFWGRVDSAAQTAARDQLTGRRFLDLDGPCGVGLTSVEIGADYYCREPGPGEAGAVAGRAIPVPMIRKAFGLSVRRLDAYLHMGQILDLSPAEDAAEAVARREEEFIYYGERQFGLEGLLTAQGRHQAQCGDWSQVERALDDVLGAVNRLEQSGFHGPYALAASPTLYNSLFRRYEGTDMVQLEHLRRLCELGVYKAPIEGAVVVDRHAGRLVLGQDLMVGYSGNDGIHYQLFVNETAVLVLQEPQAVCSLSP
ncbi:MAG TPA: family 1 encapsulin nanocompartment shell protein [Gammaproteobacteria bacterium]|nr:family 1 encapsulin nanocompartment shell protein [Gammaproteobacteria bacterium]